jgi:hypothetical protein
MAYLNSNETTTMVASRTITPSQGAEGKYFIFIGTIPQEIIINTPTVVASTMVAPISAAAPTEEEYEEVYFALTQKGIDNKIMNSPPEPQRRRRRPTKKAISPKTASTSKVFQKRTREVPQERLVVRPNIPVSNSFSVLRVVAESPSRGQNRQVWEVSSRKPQQNQKQPVSAVTLKERRNLTTGKLRYQIPDQTQNRVSVKSRLNFPSQDQVSQNWRNRALSSRETRKRKKSENHARVGPCNF